MKWTIFIAAVFNVLCFQSASFSQESPQLNVHSGFFAENGLVEFRLQTGRLILNPSRYRKGAAKFSPGGECKPACSPNNTPIAAEPNPDSDAARSSELITVMATAGIPSIHYVWHRPKQTLTVIVQDATELQIESEWLQTGEVATLRQNEKGDLVWKVTRGQLQDEYRGASLLHLYAQDPIGLQMHCGELFKRLLRGRTLGEICKQTNEQLLARLQQSSATDAHQGASKDRLLNLVEGLRSDKAQRRRKSACELMKLGTPAVPLMREILATHPLELEQRERLNKVVTRLASSVNATPASLASHLINDSRHWKHVAEELSDQQIQRVDRRLAELNLDTTGVSPTSRVYSAKPPVRVASAKDRP